jgi:hypothetical protein
MDSAREELSSSTVARLCAARLSTSGTDSQRHLPGPTHPDAEDAAYAPGASTGKLPRNEVPYPVFSCPKAPTLHNEGQVLLIYGTH